MKNNIEQIWIEAGYELFAKDGPKGLKVEQMARKVGKSKSSFYHLFADLEVFQEKLLQYHYKRSKEVAAQAAQCKTLVPELLNLLLEIKQDLLFNRQLRIHRDNPAFQKCFEAANTLVEEAFMDIWAEAFGLSEKPHVARNIMKITTDNFYLRISEENLSYDTLVSFLDELKQIVIDIVSQGWNDPNNQKSK
jgi:AcrR family transcriptional regulator